MKLVVSQMREPGSLVITGREPWLASIYKEFRTGEALISGTLHYEPRHGGAVRIRGQIAFEPQIGCGRCDRSIPWDLGHTFDLLYREREGDDPRRERDLIREELDFYYIENDIIDLEIVINEQLQLVLPSQAVRRDPTGKMCLVCGDDVSSTLVAGPKDDRSQSPFAKLKSLIPD